MQRVILLLVILGLSYSQKFVLCGGGAFDDISEPFTRFVQVAGKNGYIGAVTAASADDVAEENGQYYVDVFKNKHGVQNVEWIPIHLSTPEIAYNEEWIEKASRMTGIFFGGGDQSRLIQLFMDESRQDTPLLKVIRDNVMAGKTVIGGTSAGTTIQQKTPMITGGESYYGFKDGLNNNKNRDDVTYDKEGGFGLFAWNIFLDTHFSCRGRQGRMMAMISQLHTPEFGIGIDESTAVYVDGNQAEVLGVQGVSFFDFRQAAVNSKDYFYNVRMHYLSSGDKVDLNTWKATHSSSKHSLAGKERYKYPKSTSYDIFSSPDNYGDKGRVNPNEFIKISQDLFDSYGSDNTHAFSYETKPSYKAEMVKVKESKAYYTADDFITYENLQVSVEISMNQVTNA